MTEEQNTERQNLPVERRGLLEELEALALCFSTKAGSIPQTAWKFWFDAVKGSTTRDAKDVISDWSKTSNRMMTPSDLYKALQAKRSQKRENEAQKEDQKNHEPLPQNIQKELDEAINASLRKNIPSEPGSRKNRIFEAYGFFLTKFIADTWRSNLNLPTDYHFEDTNGVFPLIDVPNERRSLYHDCRLHFWKEYEARYGYELVYDKELAKKRYPTLPLRWTGAAQSIGVNDTDF